MKVCADSGEHRGEWEHLLADAEAGEFSTVVVASLRRPDVPRRSAAHQAITLDRLGVTVSQAKQHDPNTSEEGPARSP